MMCGFSKSSCGPGRSPSANAPRPLGPTTDASGEAATNSRNRRREVFIVPFPNMPLACRGGFPVRRAHRPERSRRGDPRLLLRELPHVPVGLPHVEEAFFVWVLADQVFVQFDA